MEIKINNNILNVKLCITPNSIRNGMMGQVFDETFNGMLFIMPEKTEQSFWMYKCIIPLDIIMIDDNIITKIHTNCPTCEDKSECTSYKGYGNLVLELPGGYCDNNNINEGDEIFFNN